MLRWIQRVHLILGAHAIALSAALWVLNDGLWWISAAAVALMLLGAASLEPAIRHVEQRGRAQSAPTPSRQRRAESITAAVLAVSTVVTAAVVYALEGVGAAFFVAALMLVSGALGLWLNRRWSS